MRTFTSRARYALGEEGECVLRAASSTSTSKNVEVGSENMEAIFAFVTFGCCFMAYWLWGAMVGDSFCCLGSNLVCVDGCWFDRGGVWDREAWRWHWLSLWKWNYGLKRRADAWLVIDRVGSASKCALLMRLWLASASRFSASSFGETFKNAL